MSRIPLSAAAVCGAALLAAAPDGLCAQAVIKGRLLSQQARLPLGEAEVVIQELNRSAFTNDSGYFRLAGVPLGVHQVLFRRIGFVPAYATLRVEAADSVTVEIMLEAVVPELETIIVTAPRVKSSRVTAFLDRMRTGQGRYLTPEQLRSREMDLFSDILREKGVRVVPDPRRLAEYAYGRGSRGRRCPMRVVLDGLDLRGDFAGPADLRRVDVKRLEAVEIYSSETTAPLEFGPPGPNNCGLLVLWTRPRRRVRHRRAPGLHEAEDGGFTSWLPPRPHVIIVSCPHDLHSSSHIVQVSPHESRTPVCCPARVRYGLQRLGATGVRQHEDRGRKDPC